MKNDDVSIEETGGSVTEETPETPPMPTISPGETIEVTAPTVGIREGTWAGETNYICDHCGVYASLDANDVKDHITRIHEVQ